MRTFASRFIVATVVICAACSGGEKAPSPGADSGKGVAPAVGAGPSAALLNPDPAKLNAQAPDSFAVHFVTSRGAFDVKVHRDWAPRGADRLYYLVNNGFFDGVRFFRVLDGFMAQFGINGNPAVVAGWRNRAIPDDAVKHGNRRGVLTFATAGPNTRTTQLFINYKDNSAMLDPQGFSGLGEVTSGMAVVDSLYKGYGEGAPQGMGPAQSRIESEGNRYLSDNFALLDSIVSTKVTQEWKAH